MLEELYLHTEPEQRTVYDLTPEECAALALPAEDRWWVTIERTEVTPTADFGPWMPDLVFGPYPTEAAAATACEDALLIEDACGSTDNPYCTQECYVTQDRSDKDEVVLVDLSDPNHTGIYPVDHAVQDHSLAHPINVEIREAGVVINSGTVSLVMSRWSERARRLILDLGVGNHLFTTDQDLQDLPTSTREDITEGIQS